MSGFVAAPPRPKHALLGLAVLVALEAGLVVCWSGGFIGMRFASDHAPIFLILLWRSLVSGLALLPFALTLGPPLRWRAAAPHILFGAVAMAGYLGAFSLAISYGAPTGLVALFTNTLPLMVAILSWPLLGQRLAAWQWIGSLIGFSGVVIASGASFRLAGAPLWSYGLPAVGTLALATGTLWLRRGPARSVPVHQSLCVHCLSAAVAFVAPAWREGGVLPPPDPAFIAGILWLVLVATLGAWGLYYLALRRSSPARVTSALYLSPPVVMIWAWLVFGEPLSWAMAAGLAVSLVGLLIVAKAHRPA